MVWLWVIMLVHASNENMKIMTYTNLKQYGVDYDSRINGMVDGNFHRTRDGVQVIM
jgi:hypothetical protein